MELTHISIAWVPQQLREYDVTRDANSIGQGWGEGTVSRRIAN